MAKLWVNETILSLKITCDLAEMSNPTSLFVCAFYMSYEIQYFTLYLENSFSINSRSIHFIWWYKNIYFSNMIDFCIILFMDKSIFHSTHLLTLFFTFFFIWTSIFLINIILFFCWILFYLWAFFITFISFCNDYLSHHVLNNLIHSRTLEIIWLTYFLFCIQRGMITRININLFIFISQLLLNYLSFMLLHFVEIVFTKKCIHCDLIKRSNTDEMRSWTGIKLHSFKWNSILVMLWYI